MINEHSLSAIQTTQIHSGFLKPLYHTYSFTQLPHTIFSLLGCGSGGLPKDCVRGETYSKVILILLDGFGWKFLQKHGPRYPFLTRFFKEGIVSKIMSQFPSTTAAHITTLCSNQPVGEHGIYEWFIYEPLLSRIIAPMIYAYAGDKKIGTLESKIEPAQLFPSNFFFQDLKKYNISCKVFQPESIAHSIYSKAMFQGAEQVGYQSWGHALSLLKQHLKSARFFYLYFGDFDAQAHRHGLESPEVLKIIDDCFCELETILMAAPEIQEKSTALLVTADHGMVDIHPSTTFYINQKIPQLEHQLKKGADGKVLAPAGSCRDFFLHVEPPFLSEVQEKLQNFLQDAAWVCRVSTLIEEGFFGPQGVSKECLARLGNLAILAKGTHSVWWYEKGRFEQNFYAMHGSLTPDEVETMFLFL